MMEHAQYHIGMNLFVSLEEMKKKRHKIRLRLLQVMLLVRYKKGILNVTINIPH